MKNQFKNAASNHIKLGELVVAIAQNRQRNSQAMSRLVC